MNGFLLAAWIGCQSFDLGSTAIARRDARIQEGNPVLNGPHGYALKISVNVGALLWQRNALKDAPGSKAGWIAPIAMASTGCLAGTLNVRTMQSLNGAK